MLRTYFAQCALNLIPETIMHPYERALIERFNNAQSLVLDNKFVPTWTIDQSDPLNLGPECQIIRLEWLDDEGRTCSTSIDRAGVQKGSFLPGATFVCTDTEGTGVHLHFTPKTTSHPTLDDFLVDQPLYAHLAFSPELLAIDITSVLGQRMAFILNPSRIYACAEEEWANLAQHALRSAHAVLAKADPAEKRTPFEHACSRQDELARSLIQDFERLLRAVDATHEYAIAPFGGPENDALYQKTQDARNDLIALFTTAIKGRPPVMWDCPQ